MKLIPLAILITVAFLCSSIRDQMGSKPTPLPRLGGVPTSAATASPSPAADQTRVDPSENAVADDELDGILNDKAILLPVAAYPPAARAVRASGKVNVKVLVDKSGRVVTATALSGHPLLRASAVQAAQKAEFKPTLVAGQAVPVTGILVYDFKQ